MPSRAQKKREKKNNYMTWTANAAKIVMKLKPENVMNEGTGTNMEQKTIGRKIYQKLSMKESNRLFKFIEAEYANQNKTDDEFAKLATETLGFNVGGAMVQKRRMALGIPATKEVIHEQIQKQKAERAAEAARKRMQRLEEQERQQKLDFQPPAPQPQQSLLIDRIRTLETQMLNLTVQVQALQNQTNNKFLTLPVYEMTPGFKGTPTGPKDN